MDNYLIKSSLKYDPFVKKSKTKYFETRDSIQLNARLNQLLQTNGIGLITGKSGSGKTCSVRTFVTRLSDKIYKVAYTSLSTTTLSQFYKELAYQLNIEPMHRKVDLHKQIKARIEELVDARVTPIIIIDEAQYLSANIINELKLILNFEMDSVDKCILILIGVPELRSKLKMSHYESLRQRIMSNYVMRGIEAAEVKEYIETALNVAGRSAPLITEDGYVTVINLYKESTRRLNMLMHTSLKILSISDKQMIDNDIIMLAQEEIEI